MKKYQFTRVETIRSIQIIQAENEELAEEQLQNEGYDESCDDVISSDTEIEEVK